jgi:multimeric flavodoxin WrbA
MKIAIVYGTQRKGSTYHIVRQFVDRLETNPDNITEFFLPKDGPNFCLGCFTCFEDFQKCPDHPKIEPILAAVEEADLLIFASPVYVYHVTGQMKALLDHLAFRWMIHRPSPSMFGKMGLIVSTAAGGGLKSAIKDISHSFWYWGVAKTYRYGKAVAAADWDKVSDKTKTRIAKDVEHLSKKILKNAAYVKPCFAVKALFYFMRFFHKKWGAIPSDAAYWKAQGWLDKKRPW